jgi:hypothetical protein
MPIGDPGSYVDYNRRELIPDSASFLLLKFQLPREWHHKVNFHHTVLPLVVFESFQLDYQNAWLVLHYSPRLVLGAKKYFLNESVLHSHRSQKNWLSVCMISSLKVLAIDARRLMFELRSMGMSKNGSLLTLTFLHFPQVMLVVITPWKIVSNQVYYRVH